MSKHKIYKIGDTRIGSMTFQPGLHPFTDGFLEIKGPDPETLQVEFRLRYRYPSLKSDPEWQVLGLAPDPDPDPVPALVEFVPLPYPWYSRFWRWLLRRPRIPAARTLSR